MNKAIISAIILILSMNLAHAKDVSISIDGKEMGGTYTISPGQTIEGSMTLAKGVRLERVRVNSTSELFTEMIRQNLPGGGMYAPIETTRSSSFIVPDAIPNLDDDVTIELLYFDAALNMKTENIVLHLQTEKTGFLSKLIGILPTQTAIELANALSHRKLDRINSSLMNEDISIEDMRYLGVTQMQVASGAVQRKELSRQTEEIEYSSVQGQDENLELSGAYNPNISVVRSVYSLSYGGKSLIKSKIVLSIPSIDKTMSNLQVVLVVPKEVAKSAGLLDTSEDAEVLKDDPVIKWAFTNIPQGETKDYSYTVNSDVQNFPTVASASATKPSMLFRMIMWIIGILGIA